LQKQNVNTKLQKLKGRQNNIFAKIECKYQIAETEGKK
jgi:hypothetical protein